MKLSTKVRYGIHAMYDLAHADADMPQSIKSIAERENIPESYLEQLLITLRKCGLVKSVRGAQGGYMLARAPHEISVGDVLRALEGDLAMLDCLIEEDACHRACACPSRTVWQKVHRGLNDIVDGITLQDMLNDYEQMAGEKVI